MKFLLLFKLGFLSVITCALVFIMLPAIILGDTKFIRELYEVLKRDFAKIRTVKKTA